MMSEWKCSYKACECNSDAEKYECDLAYKTNKMSKDQLSKLLKQEKEWTAMFDSDVRVGLALLEEIRKLNQNKDER
jgi:hypothetical protein